MLLILQNKYKRRKNIGRRRINLKRSLKQQYLNEELNRTYEDSTSPLTTLQERIELKDTDPVIFKVENETVLNSQETEIKNNGSMRPKIAITTSKTPSKRLLIFIKELRLIFPNSECVIRGDFVMSQMINICKAHGFTDLIVVHEYMEVPDSLIICHLPYGLTTSFTLSGVIMHCDMPVVARMSEQIPHIVFNNFRSYLSMKIMLILKYLLSETNSESQRVITFTHEDGYISFRQHTLYPEQVGEIVNPKEAGPRFQLKLIEMKLETPEALDAADAEWVLRPYLNTSQLLRRLG